MINIRNDLPRKLTITMWDFSWYTMTMPGEPYSDLSARFKEAVERGYNTIRICAMPFMLIDSVIFTICSQNPYFVHMFLFLTHRKISTIAIRINIIDMKSLPNDLIMYLLS